MEYYLKKSVDYSFEEALEKVTSALQKEGFGVLTEIDVKATMKKKLDIDFRNYKILGACNPPLAHKALSADGQIGNLLPCNVVVQEDEKNGVIVSAINPETMMSVSDQTELKDVAEEVNVKLQNVLNNL